MSRDKGPVAARGQVGRGGGTHPPPAVAEEVEEEFVGANRDRSALGDCRGRPGHDLDHRPLWLSRSPASMLSVGTPRVDSYSFIATSPPDLGGSDPPPRKARLVIGGASWARAVTLPEAGAVVVECDAHGAQPACCSCPSLRGAAAELGTRMTRSCPSPEPAPRVTRPRKAGLRLPVCSKRGSTRHVPSDSPLGQNFFQKKRNPGFGISCASQRTIPTPMP